MVGAVGVGEVLPPFHDLAERSVGQLFGVVDELIDHFTQPVTAARVGPHPCQLGDLGDAEMPVQKCVTDGGVLVDQAGFAAGRVGFGG